MKKLLALISTAGLLSLCDTGHAQTNWNAFNDFWYTKGQGWTGSTTPNAWDYKAGNVAGGAYSNIGTFLPSSHIYDLATGGSSGAGNGTGDGNVTLYTVNNGDGINTLGRYTNGTVYVTGAKAAGGAVISLGTKATNGFAGGGALFDGTTSYIDVGDDATVNPPAVTYSVWVKPSALTAAYAGIISKDEASRVGTMLLKSNGKLAGYFLANGGIVNYDGSGASTITTGNWYYLTMTYDSVNGLKGYVNGALDGAAGPNGDLATGADKVWFGAHPSFGDRGYKGTMDEARISTVARSGDWVWAEWMNMASNSVFGSYGARAANSGGTFAAWGHKSQITFSGYTKSETLTNFPVLVNIGTNISGFSWAQFANGNGNELRFTDGAGNEIPFERDNGSSAWTNAAGVGQVWVKVPLLTSSTTITAYWGNAAATGSLPSYATDGSVWANNFGGVYHLPDSVNLSTADSTANDNDGTVPSTSSSVEAGYVGGAATLNGTGAYINVGNSATVNPTALTYSAWVNPSILSAAYASIISKGEAGRVGTLLLKSNGKLAGYFVTTGGLVNYDGTGAKTVTAGNWYYLAMAYDSINGLRGYINGEADGSAGPNGDVTTAVDPVWIGSHPSIGGRSYNGVLDEARISTVARSGDWVWAEWMNMASNSVFGSYGARTANSGGTFAAWGHKSQITFSGYTKSETLTDFPILVNIGTNISGFSWAQFANANGYELRFTDGAGNEIPYERDNGSGASWTNGAGIGQVWVKVPQLTSSTTITAYWGNAAATSSLPAYTTNGAVWSNGYGGVYHLPTPGQILSVLDSSPNQNNGQAAVTPGGIGYNNTQYLWAQAVNFHLVSGATPPSPDEGFASILTWTAPHGGAYHFTGSFLPGQNIGVPGQTNVTVAIVNSLGGTNLPRTVLPQGGSATNYDFTLTLNTGDIVQFQVGDNLETAAPVGIAANVVQVPSPPVLLSATRSLLDSTRVSVRFADELYAPSVGDLTNYSINNGIKVTAAQLDPNDSKVILLTVAPGVNYPSTLTVSGVQGSFGQLPVAPGSQVSINLNYHIPNGFGVPTNAAVVSFSGPTLDSRWQSSIVNFDNVQSNYYFSQVFVQSNGVLHVRANNQNTDYNFLVFVDPAYQGVEQETLMRLTIKAANFSGTAVAGAAVGVSPSAVVSLPPGGNTMRAVPANYGSGPNFPTFVAASDFVADVYPTNGYQPWVIGGSYWIRIRQVVDTNAPGTGAIVSAKAWPGDGSTPEPVEWALTYKDDCGLDRTGYGAIRAGWGIGAVLDFDVDYFQVTAAGLPTVTPKLPASLIPRIDVAIVSSGSNVVVSWPAAAPVAYTLQSSASITGTWTNVAAPVVLNGDKNTVTLPNNGPQYFRLIQ